MRKTPMKGEPDFSPYTDEQVREMREVTERLRVAFLYDPEISSAFSVACSALVGECTDRLASKPFKGGIALLKKKSLKFNQKLRSDKNDD